tara:strand:- start:103 stop:732 length:630 start_codon:yes stop_codon:yes gene_type:complete
MVLKKSIPEATVRRFSLYLRELEELGVAKNDSINSKDLGKRLGLSDVQVRKDLSFLKQCGRPGVGYRVSLLSKELKTILGKGKKIPTIVIGAGKIGQAICSYPRFGERGFEIIAVFDSSKEVIGQKVASHKVKDIKDIKAVCLKNNIQLGVLAVPPEAARRVSRQLIDVGIMGVLNFAPTHLDLPDGVAVIDVDFSLALDELRFAIFQE